MKVLLLTFKGFLVLSVPVFLIIIASDIVIKTRFIYEYDFWRYEISEKTGRRTLVHALFFSHFL